MNTVGFVLIWVIIWGGHNSTGSAEFTSKQSCEVAATTLFDKLPIAYKHTAVAVCVPK